MHDLKIPNAKGFLRSSSSYGGHGKSQKLAAVLAPLFWGLNIFWRLALWPFGIFQSALLFCRQRRGDCYG
jgi:hypothetical protein